MPDPVPHAAAPYAELHAHSAYSFLDGSSLPAELAGRARDLGYRALALTDHDSVAGSMEFAHTCQVAGIQAIHGAEVSVGEQHLTLLVAEQRGWGNLCRLLTLAHAGTRDGPQRKRGEPTLSLEQVLEY